MIQKKLLQLMKKYGLRAFFYRYSPQFQDEAVISSKIRFGQAMHLERRGRTEEAIELLKQAAFLFPPSGFEHLKKAAKLAEKSSMYKEASQLWLESIYYTSDFRLKLHSIRSAIKSLILYKSRT
jgi:tetratricopeptide (TPR) repeat protein